MKRRGKMKQEVERPEAKEEVIYVPRTVVVTLVWKDGKLVSKEGSEREVPQEWHWWV